MIVPSCSLPRLEGIRRHSLSAFIAYLHIILLLQCALVTASSPASSNQEVSMGTTIVALRTKEGVVVGADTRTSMSTMVSNRFADKVSLLYQNGPVSCVMCRSGSAADTQYLADECRWAFRSRALQYGPEAVSIGQIARWLRYVVMNGNYGASLLCAGYDPREGGCIYSIAPSGSLMEEKVFAAAGSGSTYILGLMDTTLKNLEEGSSEFIGEEDAIELVTRLIHSAVARDGSSGGVARILVMNSQGSRELIRHQPSRGVETGAKIEELKGFKAATPPRKLPSPIFPQSA